jgi:hypothetical protein
MRPRPYNRVLNENGTAYASYTRLGGRWVGALFARRDIRDDDLIAFYDGRLYKSADADRVRDQQYMMKVRDPTDGRKRVVIDGHPKYGGLGGFANFAEGRHANARFVLETTEGDTRPVVAVRAVGAIPMGTEIRIDYDKGSSKHPFRDQMVEEGVPLASLRSSEYKQVIWPYPRSATAQRMSHGLSDW